LGYQCEELLVFYRTEGLYDTLPIIRTFLRE
jgi:hypothetical protein